MNKLTLLILGCGYIGSQLACQALERGMRVIATTRSTKHAATLRSANIEALVVDHLDSIPNEVLRTTDFLLDSIPLEVNNSHCEPPQRHFLASLAPQLHQIRWIGYLSSTSVYGDAGGAWIDESFTCHPTSKRGQARLEAERLWLDSQLPVEIFRLAGIYGPGRNLMPKLKNGGYRAIRWQPPHYANRIHRDDIVSALLAAMDRPGAGRIVNLCDDLPFPHDEYVLELARISNAPEPIILDAENAKCELSAAAFDFFRDNKRLSNQKLHDELLPELQYPSFREGFAKCNYSAHP
ncbi:MAG: SDR family oxidoreductase [Mariprofundaceae bacterium]